jgi:hypothetical protein
MYTSNSRAYFSCARRNLHPPKRLLFGSPVGWYDVFMSRDTEALLDAFEHLPVEEKRAFTQEVLRRSLPFDSGPLEDEAIGAASAALFESLEEYHGSMKTKMKTSLTPSRNRRMP